jgi:hypothetical protein
MAAVIGDYIADHSRFHNMIGTTGLPHDHHSHSHDTAYDSDRARPREVPPQGAPSPESPTHYRSPNSDVAHSKRSWESAGATSGPEQKPISSTGGASRFPTPPEPDPAASVRSSAQNANGVSADFMASQTQAAAPAVTSSTPTQSQQLPQQQPSPEAEAFRSSSRSSKASATTPQGKTVVVRDLAHIQSLARADLMNGGEGPGILNDQPLQAMKYEISGMPIGDIIEMVAALLSKITTTNDLQHDALHRNATHQQTAAGHNNDGTSMSPLSSSVLAFHGKNVPAITILSYLSRIHKYCPTTYEVFLSLLVYFDRMTERVNNMVIQAEESRRQAQVNQEPQNKSPAAEQQPGVRRSVDTEMRDSSIDSGETGRDLADGGKDNGSKESANTATEETSVAAPPSPATYFVVDSFNIHRLIIAGVTCASKFFSDVFYTNSRYAKVGGLPLAELNHLEVQFLLLNDFRLSVPVEDLEAYATMLVEFYAREVVAPRPRTTEPE